MGDILMFLWNIEFASYICKLDIENEIHFLLECPVLETSRHDIIKELENKFKNLKHLDNKSKFIWLMSAEDMISFISC